ncbi:MAG: argininosuccinate lyase, partial [Candidatus Micrarchaeota archaeon]|nr:argininosuccinate lyase [Candidatus Micrarchaeota archaeon]
TSKELGFSKVLENPIYAQHARAKFAAGTLAVFAQVMFDLNRFATDLAFFSMSEFGFAKLPAEFTTGSSIMPQKRNPDVCELMRAKYHMLVGYQAQLAGLSANLLHGYNRDMQLSSEILVDAAQTTLSSLSMAAALVSKVEFDKAKCEASLTPELYATEEAYKLVKGGLAFRDAYHQVSEKYKK